MITREEAYTYLYRVFKSTAINLHDVDADKASRLANIYAVKETNKFWYHSHLDPMIVDMVVRVISN